MDDSSQGITVDINGDEWKEFPAPENNPHYWVLLSEIEKSKSDDRNCKFIKLKNGFQILLIQDSDTDIAAVAMNVGVGYLSDPDEMPGLAHLCEHVIYTGNQKCWSFVRKNGGSINAHTVESNTCYYLSIGQDKLNEAVGLFSTCFTTPKFDTSCVTNEVKTVDSEFEAGHQSDLHRLYQVFKTNALPGHSWLKFPTGNKDEKSLGGVDVPAVNQKRRDKLQKWWETYYSPSIMGLVIVGRESLEELTTMAFNFQHIPLATPTDPIPLPTEKDLPWGENQKRKITFVKSVMDIPTIEVTFCLPSQDQYYESKPTAYISRLLTHEGPGSLHSFLKNEHLITGLCIESSASPHGFCFWGIKAKLTEEGFVFYDRVVRAIYAYLTLLERELTPSSGHFEEFKNLQNNRFYYSQKENVGAHVGRLSERLLLPWPRRRLLKAATGVWKQDDKIVRTILQEWLVPPASSVTLTSTNDLHLMDIEGPCSVEEWYGTEYIRQELPPYLFKQIGPDMSLPGLNEYIPKDFDTKTTKYPALLSETGLSELWFKQDDQFFLPKGYIGVYLRNPILYDCPENTVMTKLVEYILTDVLEEQFYDALVAGLQFSLVYNNDGNMILQLGGYTDGMLLLLGNLLEAVDSFIIREDAFSLHSDKLSKGLENAQLAEACVIARQLMERGLVGNAWTDIEMRDALINLTSDKVQALDRVQAHLRTLFSPGAIQAQKTVEKVLKSPINSSAVMKSSANEVPKGHNWVYTCKLENVEDKNNAVRYYLQIADDSTGMQARLLLLAHIIHEPFFHTLRTEENLGYEVSSAPWVQPSVIGMLFMVQSERSTVAVENSIEKFLTHFGGKKLGLMKDFEPQRDALVEKLKEKPENLDQESMRFAFSILSGRRNPKGSYDFSLRDEIAEKIARLQSSDILEFHRKHIIPAYSLEHLAGKGSIGHEFVVPKDVLSSTSLKDNLHVHGYPIPPVSHSLPANRPPSLLVPNPSCAKVSIHVLSQVPHAEDSTEKRRSYDDVKDPRIFRSSEWLGTLPTSPT